MGTLESQTESALSIWRQERQPEALGTLLKQRRDRAYAVALRITGSVADAEDAVQDAFVKLLSRTHGFENAEAFESAVIRAVVQCALDILKSRRRRCSRESTAGPELGALNTVTDAGPPLSSTEHDELRVLVREALQELHEDERTPVVLCCQQGLSVAQAARILDVPRETLRARLDRALETLRIRLRRAGPFVVFLPALLWEEGTAQASENLCARLDAVLPGKPCTEVTVLARPTPPVEEILTAQATVKTVGKSWLTWSACGCIAALSLTLLYTARGPELSTSRKVGPAAERSERIVQVLSKEEVEMKPVISAVVLSGAILLPGVVRAGDTNSDVAQVLKEIEARKAAKAEAEAKVAKEYQRHEAQGEYRWVRPGGLQSGTGTAGGNPGKRAPGQ